MGAMNEQQTRCCAMVARLFIGCAVGDGLGRPFEHRTGVAIQEVAGFVRSSASLEFTDDTEMLLFIGEAIGTGAWAERDIERFLCDWERTYSCSLPHATYLSYIKALGYVDPPQLLLMPEMFAHAGVPGLTCMSSIRALAALREDPTLNPRRSNDSKGNGSLLRCAPFVVLAQSASAFLQPMQSAFRRAKAQTGVTHDHAWAWQCDMVLLETLRGIGMDGKALEDSLRDALRTLLGAIDEELRQALLVWCFEADPYVLQKTGFVAEECLAMAFRSATSFGEDFDAAMTQAICHDGDSDSVAALTGLLLAARGIMPPERQVARLGRQRPIAYVSGLFSTSIDEQEPQQGDAA